MPQQFYDKLTIDASARTKDGFLATSARVARTGIQLYKGSEVGKPDMPIVRVYRPPEAVFDEKSMRSMAFRPIVLGHGDGIDITSKNWRDRGRGMTGGDILRDGEFVRVPMVLMDEEAIARVEAGERELSWGYQAKIEFKDGLTPDTNEPYDAIQSELRMNHLAIVGAARGGSNLRIGDEAEEPDMANKIVMLDGLSVETTEAGAQAIEKLQRDIKGVRDQATADLATRDTTITQLKADVSKKDGEMAIMKKQIEDGVMTPAKLDAAVVARAAIIADAKKIGGENLVVAGKTDAEIRRAAIAIHLGDAEATKLDDAAIAGAFAFAAKQGGGTSNGNVQPLRQALSSLPVNLGDAQKKADDAHALYVKDLQDGYKTPRQEEAVH